MKHKYRITLIGIPLDTSVCPPKIVKKVFPNFQNEEVYLSSEEVIVTFNTEQIPNNLGPLVDVEKIIE